MAEKVKYKEMYLELINLTSIKKVLVVAHKYFNGKNVYVMLPNAQLNNDAKNNDKVIKRGYKNIISECNLILTLQA